MKKITCQDIKVIKSQIHEHGEKCKNDLMSALCADIKAELLKSSNPMQITICKPAVEKIFYHISSADKKWVNEILSRYNQKEIETFAPQIGFSVETYLEEIDFEQKIKYFKFSFSEVEDSHLPQTEVQALARKIRKRIQHERKKQRGIYRRQNLEAMMAYYKNQKAEKLNAYWVYLKCIRKLKKRDFIIQNFNLITIKFESNLGNYDWGKLVKLFKRENMTLMHPSDYSITVKIDD